MDSVVYLEGRGKPLKVFNMEEFQDHIEDIKGKLSSQGGEHPQDESEEAKGDVD